MAEITQARDIPPLPLDLVNAVIQEIQKTRPLFLYSYPLNDVSLVVRLYQSAFSGSTPVSSAHLACTYGTLYFILREFRYLQSPICQKFDFNEAISLAEKKFDVLLKDYRVLSVPSFGNVLALTLGAMKAQNQGSPFLNCTLISAAASHCQSLGYNHDSSHGNSSNSRRLFWSVYMLEKEVSIFFGRASALQDADIDVALPVFSRKRPVERWDRLFEAGIKLAKIQRRICNDLYSRKSLKLGQTERENKIHDTVQKAHHFYDNRMYYTLTLSDGPERLFRLAEDMLETKRSATLTTLLRAPSSLKTGQTHIRPECFKAARTTLKLYLHCSRACELGGLSSETERYRDWGPLSCILTPFIVISLHAIASSSAEDITLLNEVVSTLEQIQDVSPSESCEKLYKFTSSFAKAATGFVQRHESIHSVSRWRYSQQDDSLSLTSREKEPSTTESLPKGRPGSSATLASASSVFTHNTDEGSLFQQVVDEDMREIIGEGAEELFRVLEGCMGGGLVSVLDVFGGGFLDV